MPNLDERDQAIYDNRQAAFLDRKSESDIRQGDFIRFKDGALKRVAHVWKDIEGFEDSVQPTSARGNSGSFYIGGGWASFSGALDSSIPFSTFKKTNEFIPDGYFWFFHHDFAYAHNGVYVFMKTPVWECSADYEKHLEMNR